jgi:hypothetical protein
LPQDIYSVHYTLCGKPWQFLAQWVSGDRSPGDAGARAITAAIHTDTVHLIHCLALVQQWHDLGTDLETKLLALTGDVNLTKSGASGYYRPEIFNGHCDGDGHRHYKRITASPATLQRVPELYNGDAAPPARRDLDLGGQQEVTVGAS